MAYEKKKKTEKQGIYQIKAWSHPQLTKHQVQSQWTETDPAS